MAASFGVSPADVLFGDTSLFADLAADHDLPQAAETSYHWLARAEASFRRSEFTECQRCVSQAMRCIGANGRALCAEEWLFLAGVALMNADHESAIHRITMAHQAASHHRTLDASNELTHRILILQSLITGVSAPAAGSAVLLSVFRFLASHCRPSLCRQALCARRLLQEWNEPGPSNPEWN